jgi:patatin-like phospholipase/acyl hydrolase
MYIYIWIYIYVYIAPTFFTPVQWEEGLYCDGALVANNPTAIALQEAKVLYPDVPIEVVVSIGIHSLSCIYLSD